MTMETGSPHGYTVKDQAPVDPFCPAGHLADTSGDALIQAALELMNFTCPSCPYWVACVCSGIAEKDGVLSVAHTPAGPASIHEHSLF